MKPQPCHVPDLPTELPGVLAGLRELTHPAHVRLNQHPLLAGLTQPGFALMRYVSVLAAFYHIYAEVESRIAEFLAQHEPIFDYARRRKLPWLTADLSHFDINPATPEFMPARPLALPPITKLGTLVGTLYVIEGATLGGQVIARRLDATLALSRGAGASFYSGYASPQTTQRRWQEFGIFASSIRYSADERLRAGKAALELFALIEEHLDDYHARLGR